GRRRRTLLSSVAALSLAALVAAPAVYLGEAALPARAHAAEAARPVGFADLVAKVKPAVISVSVKMEATGALAQSGDSQSRDSQQFSMPGFPHDFFRRFGYDSACS